MNPSEVSNPILNSPFEEPKQYWYLQEGAEPECRNGRRKSTVFPPRNQTEEWDTSDGTLRKSSAAASAYELVLVNLIRERVKAWRDQGYPGSTRTTAELLQYWRREGRERRLFFAQLEAAETVIFLTEARQDFRQGVTVPMDEPSKQQQEDGMKAFRRHAAKVATGGGKTTIMGMLAAWSILNKVTDRSDGRFSDAVLVVCPNVTIRSRLAELDPESGEASVYRTRDIVPPQLMPSLRQGKVMVTNWHIFEPQTPQTAGVSAKVTKVGVPIRTKETFKIAVKTTTARDKKYITLQGLELRKLDGAKILDEKHDAAGNLIAVTLDSHRFIESETGWLNRVLGKEFGGKQNFLIMNDEAHHAYRIRNDGAKDCDDDEDDDDYEIKEATVWVEGLDRIHKGRGINICLDFSATPFFLGRVGKDTNRPFPWVVSDFGLIEAIESGLVKIPQLAVRDTTGADIPGYFNIWNWIMPQLTSAERGGTKANPKPEAILKYAHHPIAMLAGLWLDLRKEWEETKGHDPRPPVFILVCKNTKIAKVMFEWLALNKQPTGIPPAKIDGFLNVEGRISTIRVDSKVVHETDTGEAKSDESRWMRFTLDTVGRLSWPSDPQGRPIYPDGFEALAQKMDKPVDPPGRDIRCIVSVGMLTEGWDCNTVTHIIGLRPFMSQLLCVTGRNSPPRSEQFFSD